MKRRSIFVLIASVIMLATTMLMPSPASASAYGCAAGNANYGPTTYCAYLSGSGTYVSYVRGDFRGSALACDYSTTAEFFDTAWRWYRTSTSSTQWGCGTGGSQTVPINATMRSGFMCSSFRYTLGGTTYRRSMSVCHRIY